MEITWSIKYPENCQEIFFKKVEHEGSKNASADFSAWNIFRAFLRIWRFWLEGFPLRPTWVITRESLISTCSTWQVYWICEKPTVLHCAMVFPTQVIHNLWGGGRSCDCFDWVVNDAHSQALPVVLKKNYIILKRNQRLKTKLVIVGKF